MLQLDGNVDVHTYVLTSLYNRPGETSPLQLDSRVGGESVRIWWQNRIPASARNRTQAVQPVASHFSGSFSRSLLFLL
jgi:hypothetical protein